MLFFSIAFLLGDCYLQTYAQLPSMQIVGITLFASILFAILLDHRCNYSYLPFALILGFSYSAWYAHSQLSWTLPKALEGKPIIITGVIASLPEISAKQISFEFVLKNNIKVKLSMYCNIETQTMCQHHYRVGDEYQWWVRLKRIHGTQNPGGFDFEAYALEKNWRATGTIIASPDNQWLSYSPYRFPINQLRQRLQGKIIAYLPSSHSAPWLLALMIGERHGVDPADWQVLRNTGTNHLMAIGGLHIGILAGIMHFLITWVWRRSPRLMLHLPAKEAGAYAALLTAWFYSALAGFSIPTQRACIMLSIFILAILTRRLISSWSVYALTLIIVLLCNPLNVLSESFWLSFGTIALIIYGMSGRLSPSGFWWHWGRVQGVIGLGLLPFSFLFFQQGSLVSFVANSIAIPWLSFLILPFCFLSTIFLWLAPAIGKIFLYFAGKSLSGLWMVLTWFSQLHFSTWTQIIPTPLSFILAMIGIILLLLPAGLKERWFGIFLLLPLIFYQPPTPKVGEVWLNLLDVGQGLSVIVQTKNHSLVYDAGPKYNSNSDMGERVVLPFLRTQGIKKIDILVVSHGDNDHIGGTSAIINTLDIAAIKTSVPEKFSKLMKVSYCLYGESWQWDGVNFTFLYPSKEALHLGNDSSCVLQIDNHQQRILLTGDIEKYAEENLLTLSPLLSSTLLVAPHHGSKTSKLANFIKAVHPSIVLYATGYRNRYHFPHPSVVAAYNKIQARQLNTAETGMINVTLKKDHASTFIKLYRRIHQRYWYAS